MKNSLLKFYIVAVYLCSTFVLFAQTPGTDDDGGILEGGDPPAAPIDDYLLLLAGIGLIYAFIKFREIQYKKIKS